MKHFIKPILVLLGLLFTGCTHSIHSVHTSDFKPYGGIAKGKMIEARSDQFVVMGFSFDTLYVDEAYNRLLSQCQGGEVKGITTQHSTSHGFFSWHNKILMQGSCIR